MIIVVQLFSRLKISDYFLYSILFYVRQKTSFKKIFWINSRKKKKNLLRGVLKNFQKQVDYSHSWGGRENEPKWGDLLVGWRERQSCRIVRCGFLLKNTRKKNKSTHRNKKKNLNTTNLVPSIFFYRRKISLSFFSASIKFC